MPSASSLLKGGMGMMTPCVGKGVPHYPSFKPCLPNLHQTTNKCLTYCICQNCQSQTSAVMHKLLDLVLIKLYSRQQEGEVGSVNIKREVWYCPAEVYALITCANKLCTASEQ
eukprot:295231-Pelagomonas_calceolata.AAC.6